MKTAVAELFDRLWDTPKDKLNWYAIRSQMLEKEKELFVDTFVEGMRCQNFDPNRGRGEQYYNATFNTNKK
jgi:hypothetical protein